ncbi:MAG: hypothetical protein C0508_03620 [Cyanobacteria bacterium PR.023]|nr:hypothetical protein [Cyanobacteria bacterium PR.023]
MPTSPVAKGEIRNNYCSGTDAQRNLSNNQFPLTTSEPNFRPSNPSNISKIITSSCILLQLLLNSPPLRHHSATTVPQAQHLAKLTYSNCSASCYQP